MGEIRNLFITLFILSGIVVGSSVFMEGLTSTYNTQSSDNFNIVFNNVSQANKTFTFINETQSSLSSANVEQGGIGDFIFGIVNGVFGIIKTFTSGIDLVTNMVSNLANILNIPSWAVLIVLGLVGVYVLFEVISFIQRYRL